MVQAFQAILAGGLSAQEWLAGIIGWMTLVSSPPSTHWSAETRVIG